MVVDTVVQAIMEETKVERVDSRTSLRLASRLLLVILAPLHLATATRLVSIGMIELRGCCTDN